MPYAYAFDEPKRLVSVRFSGDVSPFELSESTTKVLFHPQFDPAYDVILDFTDAVTVSISTDEIHSLVEFHRRLSDRLPAARLALVAKRPLVYRCLQTWHTRTEDLPFTAMVFWARKTAIAWIREGRRARGTEEE